MTLPASWCFRLDGRPARGLRERPGRRDVAGRGDRSYQQAEVGSGPAEWLPPAPEVQCRYVGEWVATKLRWQLAADAAELEALKAFADGPCEETVLSYTPAP